MPSNPAEKFGYGYEDLALLMSRENDHVCGETVRCVQSADGPGPAVA